MFHRLRDQLTRAQVATTCKMARPPVVGLCLHALGEPAFRAFHVLWILAPLPGQIPTTPSVRHWNDGEEEEKGERPFPSGLPHKHDTLAP